MGSPKKPPSRAAKARWAEERVGSELTLSARILRIFEAMNPIVGDYAVTEYERIVEQGRRKGLRQGRAALLLTLLEAKLGPLTSAVKARVRAATPAEVTTWATRILTAATFADVFDAPAAPAAEARQPATRAARRSDSTPRGSNRPRR